MESLAPAELAEDWDSVGLQIGSRNWKVSRIWTALDPLPEVIEAACGAEVDLLITHHPFLFSPLKSIDFDTPLGRSIEKAVTHRLAVFSAHTNLDSAAGGLNDLLAGRIGLHRCRPLRPADVSMPAPGAGSPRSGPASFSAVGLGRVGRLRMQTRLSELAQHVRKELGLEAVRAVGDPELKIDRVAVCSGSGRGLLAEFFASEAQVYISGDLGYHDARAVEEAGRGLIDIGHFASEHIVVTDLAGRLSGSLSASGFDIEIAPCRLERDPFSPVR